MPDQPNDRGICGAAAPTLTPSTYGGVCDMLAGHTGWHSSADGMRWGPTTAALTQADVDVAYQRGLAEGRRQATEGAADRAEAAMRAESDRLAAPGTARAVEQGIGVAHAMSAVRREIVGPWETAEQPEAAPCCDLHGRNCEQGGEECCERCTEAHHFALGHGGVPCSSPVFPGAEPASGGVVEPSPLTAEEATPNCVVRPKRGVPVAEEVDFSVGIGEGGPIRRADRKPTRRPHDPGALMEEPDLHPKTFDPEDERRADDAHMAAMEAQMEHDADQCEGDDHV